MDKSTLDFKYNTASEDLVIPEYGRNIQDLINYCKTIELAEYRQTFAEEIINLMHIITPYNKNMDEHKKKLWHHFFRIAKYDIDVMPPTGIKPTPEEDTLNPQSIAYPKGTDTYRHYGSYVNQLIRKALEMEKGPKRDEFAQIIGSYMKMAFKNWNREHYVSDDIIKNDLNHMSKGELLMDDDVQFNTLVDSAPKSQKRNHRNSGKQNYRSKKGNNNKYRSNKRRA